MENTNICIRHHANPIFISKEIEEFRESNYHSPHSLYELLRYAAASFKVEEPNLSSIRGADACKIKFNCAKFPDVLSLNRHLEDQAQLDVYETIIPVQNLCLFKCVMYESFEFPYLVNKDFMIFPVNNGFVNLYQNSNADVLMITIKRAYGNVYLSLIKRRVAMVGPIGDIVNQTLAELVDEKNRVLEDAVVKIRFFRKQLYGRIMDLGTQFSVFGNVQVSLNWVDYLKGVKLIDE